MPDFLQQLLAQLKGIWSRLDGGQRLTIMVVMGAMTAGLGSIIWFAGQPSYVAVLTNPDPGELQRAAQALDGKVAYRIDGSSLTVDYDDQDKAKQALLAGGAWTPQAENDFGNLMGDRMTREHALEKKKERDAEAKLMKIRGVLLAQVSHSRPKRPLYRVLDEESQPRANVGLQLRAGTNFYAVARVAVMQTSAALAIPEKYITVTDLDTAARYLPEEAGGSRLDTSEFLSQQRRRSVELTEHVQTLLDAWFPRQAVVRVQVDLDPEWQLEKERSAPERQIVKSTKTVKEDTKGGSSGASGDPSASPASSTIGTSATGPAAAVHSKQSKETEYSENGYVEITRGKLAPDVRKISVAVLIDKKALGDTKPSEIEELVKSAVGWQQGRDEIAIHTGSLAAPPEAPSVAAETLWTSVMKLAPAVGQVLAVILVLLFLRGLLRKNNMRGGALRSSTGQEEEKPEEITPDELARRMRREIERSIGEDPASISRLLESWLMEQRS